MRVYYIDMPAEIPPAIKERWLGELYETKRQRAQRFKKEEHIISLLVSDRLVKFALNDYAGISVGPEDFIFSERGKPYISGGIFFNLSHSGGAAVCAVDKAEVGADIERVHEVRPEVAKRIMSKAEFGAYKASGYDKRHFCAIWALKESYVKFIGTGISYPLTKLSFELNTKGGYKASNIEGARFATFDLPGYAAAVCYKTEEEPELRKVLFSELLNTNSV
ncbi:MAG: 4'-phosphopantetheinyl transferase family protein [Christensenellales bacterium]|jgi:4'-phosphopantetheinyl transferase